MAVLRTVQNFRAIFFWIRRNQIFCAGKIGGTKKFYGYIDALYGYKINNKSTQLPITGKEDIAKGLGIESEIFNECIKSDESEIFVGTSINDGVTAGVEGTPSSFILVKNSKGYEVVAMIDGARPLEYFKAAIEEALSR